EDVGQARVTRLLQAPAPHWARPVVGEVVRSQRDRDESDWLGGTMFDELASDLVEPCGSRMRFVADRVKVRAAPPVVRVRGDRQRDPGDGGPEGEQPARLRRAGRRRKCNREG